MSHQSALSLLHTADAGSGRPRTRSDSSPDGRVVAALVRAAAAGDEDAWRSLVKRFTPALRAAARGFRLPHQDVDDVVQNTWLAAFRQIHRLRKPESFGSWLLVTARRESLLAFQRGVREIPADELPDPPQPERETPESAVVERERRQAVEAAVSRLPGRQRVLLDTLLRSPGSSYDELSRKLDMPIGSIGPTRERAFGRLRRDDRLGDVLRDQPAA